LFQVLSLVEPALVFVVRILLDVELFLNLVQLFGVFFLGLP
jgi:hypothetical protein